MHDSHDFQTSLQYYKSVDLLYIVCVRVCVCEHFIIKVACRVSPCISTIILTVTNANLNSIVECRRGRMQREVLQGSNTWQLPSLSFSPISCQHVICECVTKYQCTGIWFLPWFSCPGNSKPIMLHTQYQRL